MIVLDNSGVDDPFALRQVYGAFPSGVTAVSALCDDVPVGFSVSSFTSVSIDPPLVSVCPARTSETWPQLARCPRLGLSVMSSTQEQACRQLAAKSAPSRLAGIDWQATEQGAVLLDDAAAWLDCSIHDVFEAGDHLLVLLRVEAFEMRRGAVPLVFHASGFRQLAVASDSL